MYIANKLYAKKKKYKENNNEPDKISNLRRKSTNHT